MTLAPRADGLPHVLDALRTDGDVLSVSPASTLMHSKPTHTRWAWWSGGVGLAVVEPVESSTFGLVGEF